MAKYICILLLKNQSSQNLNIILSLDMFSSWYMDRFHYHWVTTGAICIDYDLFCKYFIWEKIENINQVYKVMNLEFIEDI